MRKNKHENLVTMGKVDGKRAGGRPIVNYVDGMSASAWENRDKSTGLIRDTDNSVGMQNMAAHAYQHST